MKKNFFNDLKNIWLSNPIQINVIASTVILSIVGFGVIFIGSHIEAMIIIMGLFGLVVGNRYISLENNKLATANQKNLQQSQNALITDQNTLRNQHELLRRIIFQLLQEFSNYLGLLQPAVYSQIQAPKDFFESEGVYYHWFVCSKKAAVDCVMIGEVLTNRLNQMLNSNEILNAGSNFIVINGNYEPIIKIHQILDNISTIDIYMVFTNQAYMNNEYYKRQYNLSNQNRGDIHDDF